jgi:hypothetical protein
VERSTEVAYKHHDLCVEKASKALPVWYGNASIITTMLGHYATRQKVTGLSPDEVIGFFNLPKSSSHIMA